MLKLSGIFSREQLALASPSRSWFHFLNTIDVHLDWYWSVLFVGPGQNTIDRAHRELAVSNHRKRLAATGSLPTRVLVSPNIGRADNNSFQSSLSAETASASAQDICHELSLQMSELCLAPEKIQAFRQQICPDLSGDNCRLELEDKALQVERFMQVVIEVQPFSITCSGDQGNATRYLSRVKFNLAGLGPNWIRQMRSAYFRIQEWWLEHYGNPAVPISHDDNVSFFHMDHETYTDYFIHLSSDFGRSVPFTAQSLLTTVRRITELDFPAKPLIKISRMIGIRETALAFTWSEVWALGKLCLKLDLPLQIRFDAACILCLIFSGMRARDAQRFRLLTNYANWDQEDFLSFFCSASKRDSLPYIARSSKLYVPDLSESEVNWWVLIINSYSEYRVTNKKEKDFLFANITDNGYEFVKPAIVSVKIKNIFRNFLGASKERIAQVTGHSARHTIISASDLIPTSPKEQYAVGLWANPSLPNKSMPKHYQDDSLRDGHNLRCRIINILTAFRNSKSADWSWCKLTDAEFGSFTKVSPAQILSRRQHPRVDDSFSDGD